MKKAVTLMPIFILALSLLYHCLKDKSGKEQYLMSA